MIKKLFINKRFFHLLSDSLVSYKMKLSILFCFILLGTSINIYLPHFFGEVTQKIIDNDLSSQLMLLGSILYIFKIIGQYFSSYYTNYLSGLIAINLKTNLINKYVASRSIHSDFIKSGDFHQRIFNETGLLQGKLVFGTMYFIKDVLFFILLLINIFIISRLLFIDILLFSVIVYFFHSTIGSKIQKVNYKRQQENANLSSLFMEILSGKDDILAFNMIEHIKVLVSNTASKIKKFLQLNSFYQALSDIFLEILITVFIISLVFILRMENTPTASIVTIIGYIVLLLWPIKSMNTYLTSLHIVIPSVQRLENVLKKIPSKNIYNAYNVHTNAPLNKITLQEIDFDYEDVVVFDKYNLQLGEGTHLLSGDNGKGKSTLAKIILGINPINGGMVEIQAKKASNVLGLVSQSPFLYNVSIRDNLQIDKQVNTAKIEKMIANFQLEELINIDLDKQAGENGKNLSGGEKQIISILRGILRDPDILIMDEVTNNLPKAIYETLLRKIIELRKNKINIIISHLPMNIEFDTIIKL